MKFSTDLSLSVDALSFFMSVEWECPRRPSPAEARVWFDPLAPPPLPESGITSSDDPRMTFFEAFFTQVHLSFSPPVSPQKPPPPYLDLMNKDIVGTSPAASSPSQPSIKHPPPLRAIPLPLILSFLTGCISASSPPFPLSLLE